MGQKINPTGLRVGVIKDWESRWYAGKADFADTLIADHKVREYLLKTLNSAGVPKVEIERDPKRVRINIHCAKPGMVIGKGGAEIEKIKSTCKKMLGAGKDIYINIIEIKQPDLNAQLVAEKIAQQLEKRVSFRRAVKQAIGSTMRLGANGIKIQCGGRLGGAEIARSETYKEGTIPLQTIRADIDYGFTEAKTTYGRIGVKVWIYKGEVLHDASANKKRRDRRA
ncbi:MAG: 30S ribosomal protein S3 [Clostridia bacterium]|nr:30S ribosomal protein S3 [Clostridia bacterium]